MFTLKSKQVLILTFLPAATLTQFALYEIKLLSPLATLSKAVNEFRTTSSQKSLGWNKS